jgi:hypothetical protein
VVILGGQNGTSRRPLGNPESYWSKLHTLR